MIGRLREGGKPLAQKMAPLLTPHPTNSLIGVPLRTIITGRPVGV